MRQRRFDNPSLQGLQLVLSVAAAFEELVCVRAGQLASERCRAEEEIAPVPLIARIRREHGANRCRIFGRETLLQQIFPSLSIEAITAHKTTLLFGGERLTFQSVLDDVPEVDNLAWQVAVQHAMVNLFGRDGMVAAGRNPSVAVAHQPEKERAAAIDLVQANVQRFAVVSVPLTDPPAEVDVDQLHAVLAASLLQLGEHYADEVIALRVHVAER